jgi:hypothetical protein
VVISELSSVSHHALYYLLSQVSSRETKTKRNIEGKTRCGGTRKRKKKEEVEEERGGKEGKRTNLHKQPFNPFSTLRTSFPKQQTFFLCE